MRFRLSIAMATVLFCGWTVVGTIAARQDWGAPEYLAYFNIPVDSTGNIIPSKTLHHKLLEYIKGATPYSEIRGHITEMSCNHDDVAEALIDAHKRRHVTVRLVHDGRELKFPDEKKGCNPTPARKLENYFGTRHKWCYQAMPLFDAYDLTSCVSSYFGPDTTHHIKNWMFEETEVAGRVRRWSSWVSSYNLTEGNEKQFEDAFIVNNHFLLYTAFITSFHSFYNQQRTTDFYNVAGRGHHLVPSANAEISYSPQASGDQVRLALSKIDGFEKGCALQVAMLAFFGRSPIVDQLVRIKELGCTVQVAVKNITETNRDALEAAGIQVRSGAEPTIHSKMMLYRGRYNGVPGRRIVWGGSHNWSRQSLRVSDEVFVGIAQPELYRRYWGYFAIIWGLGVA